MKAARWRGPWLRIAVAALLVGLAGSSCASAAYATLHPSCRAGLGDPACTTGIGMLAVGGALLGSGIGLILAILFDGVARKAAAEPRRAHARLRCAPPLRERLRWRWQAVKRSWWRHGPSPALLIAAGVALAAAGGFVLDVFVRSPWPADTTLRHLQARRNCDAARAVGHAPAYRGQPGYWPHLDADQDGIACEPYARRWW